MLVLFLIPEQILRCIKWEARHVSVAQVRMSAKSAPKQPSLSAGITFCLWGVPLRATPCEDGGMAGEWSSWRQNPRPQFKWARACQGCAHGDLIFTQPETARWAAIAMGLRGAKQGKCMSGPFRRLFAGNAICCSPRGLRCTLGRGMSRRVVQRQRMAANHLARTCPRAAYSPAGVCDEINDGCFFSAAAPTRFCSLGTSPVIALPSSCHHDARSFLLRVL